MCPEKESIYKVCLREREKEIVPNRLMTLRKLFTQRMLNAHDTENFPIRRNPGVGN